MLEVHGEERGVGQAVAEAKRVVELDAVEDAGPVVEAEDVVGEEVAVAVDGPAVGDPLLEELRPAVEVRGRRAPGPTSMPGVDDAERVLEEARRCWPASALVVASTRRRRRRPRRCARRSAVEGGDLVGDLADLVIEVDVGR